MAIVCSNCEVAPAPSAAAGAACAACGERLIVVDASEDLIGATFDNRFEILSVLGRGGMGVIYRAKQLSIGREVAIKVIDRRFENDVGAVKRFFREGKVASTLQHPNTVPIIDFGQTAEGQLFLAMELIKGQTLLEEINQKGAMPVSRIAVIGGQLCDALEAAHDLQIIHRDLKLENVMLLDGKRDLVRILDFGLARSLVDPNSAITRADLISGTPRYMAPEVGIEGAAPEPSQDMYSIGVMLAELSIGKMLWSAPTIEMLFTKKLAIDDSIAAVPAALRPLVRSLISDRPGSRPTAAQTRQHLRELELDGSAPRQPRAQSPIALEPTTDIQVEVSTSGVAAVLGAGADPFAALDNLDAQLAGHPGIVSLDEISQPPPAEVKHAASIAPLAAVPIADDDPRFELPKGQELRAEELTIDPSDLLQKTPRMAARKPLPGGVVKKSKLPAILVTVVLLGGLVGGGYYYWFIHRKGPATERLEGHGITITITADRTREIQIDGNRAGRTPVKLELRKGTKPILITGEGVASKQVVPDRDQTVELEILK